MTRTEKLVDRKNFNLFYWIEASTWKMSHARSQRIIGPIMQLSMCVCIHRTLAEVVGHWSKNWPSKYPPDARLKEKASSP